MNSQTIGAVIYDPVVEGLEHASFNYSLVASAAIAFNPLHVMFRASSSHIDYLARTTDLFQRYHIVPVVVVNAPRRVRDIVRIKWDLPNLLRAMRSARGTKHRKLIVSNATTSTILALALARLCSRVCGFGVATSVVLHSVVAELWGWRSRNPLRRMVDTRSVMALLSRTNIRFWVLEEGIRRELIATMPRTAAQVDVFPHPVRDDECISAGVPLCAPIRFGFLGRAMKAKNFHIFLEIASVVRKAIGSRAEFHVVGAQVEVFAPELLANLRTLPAASPLERRAYLSLVRSLHYVVLLNGDTYRYIASGSTLDAVAALRPLIALDEPINHDLLRGDGDIGFLCKDASEIVRLAITLATQPDLARYAKQVNNLVRLRETRSPARLAGRLRSLLDVSV